MAKKRYSIEEYIKKHLDSISQNSGEEKTHALEANTAFSSAVSAALGKAASSSVGFGKKAEGLYGLGLKNSGYADYLDKMSRATLKSDLQMANTKRISTTEEAIKNAQLKAESLLSLEDKLSSYAVKNNLSDRDFLNAYAKRLGISQERITQAVENAIAANEKHKRDKNYNAVHKNIVERRLTKREAYQYALSLGLSEDDATELGEIAYKINESLDEQ